MQKIIIIALLFACVYSATVTSAAPHSLCTGTGDEAGFVINAGVC